MKQKLRIPAAVLYAASFLTLVLYLYIELNPMMMIFPAERLFLLAIICVSAYFGSLLFSKTVTDGRYNIIMKATFWAFFGLYILLLTSLVLFDSYFGRVGLSLFTRWDKDTLNFQLQNSLNIIPFKTISNIFTGFFVTSKLGAREFAVNIIGNLIAFSPFALFLPLLFKKAKSFKSFFIIMIGIVFTVEVLQFFLLTGHCDVDDIILNVGGACILFWILHLRPIKKLISKITALPY